MKGRAKGLLCFYDVYTEEDGGTETQREERRRESKSIGRPIDLHPLRSIGGPIDLKGGAKTRQVGIPKQSLLLFIQARLRAPSRSIGPPIDL